MKSDLYKEMQEDARWSLIESLEEAAELHRILLSREENCAA